MFSIPSEIKVGGYTYTIEKKSPVYVDNSPCYGGCDFSRKVIELDSEYESTMPETLIHELLHAIVEESGLRDLKNADEETIIRVMSKGLIQVMEQNNFSLVTNKI